MCVWCVGVDCIQLYMLAKEIKRKINRNLRHKNDKENKEKYEDAKYFDHEPSIFGDRLEILQYFTMRSFDIQFGILHVGIDTFNHFVLLFDHVSQLLEYTAQFDDCAFDVLHCFCSLLHIIITFIVQHQLLLLPLLTRQQRR